MTTKTRLRRSPAFSLATLLALLLCQCGTVQHSESVYGSGGISTNTISRATKLSVADESRPGLGTSWGEGRRSQVQGTEFVRASRSPSARFAIRYNDAAGVPEQKWSTRQPFYIGQLASITIKSKGRQLKAYSAGSGPVVIGKGGERYSIHIRNRTEQRIEVVLSVDGLDVLDGKSASYGKRGYVIQPRGRLEVEGFRRSFESVAAFRFGAVGASYAARSTGSSRNVGVIGTAVFKEKATGDWDVRKEANPFPGERGSGRFANPPG